MNVSKQSVIMGKTVLIKNAQALIEGTLHLPPSLEEIASVLAVDGQCKVLSCEAAGDNTDVEGTIRYHILYVDKNGNISTFEAECTFKHAAQTPGITEGMQVSCEVNIPDTDFKATDANNIDVKSVLSIDINAVDNSEEDVIDRIGDVDGLQVKQANVEIPYVLSAKNVKSYLKNEFRVPQSMPPVKEVLMSKAYVMIRKIVKETEKLAVEGEVRVFVLYLSTDKNAPMQYMNETLPFGEIIADPKCSSECMAFAEASVEEFDVSCSEMDEDNLIVKGVISIKTYCYGTKQYLLMQDTYAKENNMDVKFMPISFNERKTYGAQKKIIRIGMSVPPQNADVSRVLFAFAYPQIVNVRAVMDKVILEGLVLLTMCYTTTDSGVKSLKMQLPFDTDLQVEGVKKDADVNVKAFAEYVSIEGSGRELDVKCCLEIGMDEISMTNMAAMSEVTLQEGQMSHDPGIVVYFANESEMLWDIAKKFRIPQKSIMKLNPEVKEGMVSKGTKLIILKD